MLPRQVADPRHRKAMMLFRAACINAASILQMALGRVGGILEAKKIAGMAEAHYTHIAPHLYCGPIEGAANIQIDTCSPNFLIQEGKETWGGLHAEILEERIRWQNGYIKPPTSQMEHANHVSRSHSRYVVLEIDSESLSGCSQDGY